MGRTVAFVESVREYVVVVNLPSKGVAPFWVPLSSIPFTPKEGMYYFVQAEDKGRWIH